MDFIPCKICYKYSPNHTLEQHKCSKCHQLGHSKTRCKNKPVRKNRFPLPRKLQQPRISICPPNELKYVMKTPSKCFFVYTYHHGSHEINILDSFTCYTNGYTVYSEENGNRTDKDLYRLSLAYPPRSNFRFFSSHGKEEFYNEAKGFAYVIKILQDRHQVMKTIYKIFPKPCSKIIQKKLDSQFEPYIISYYQGS